MVPTGADGRPGTRHPCEWPRFRRRHRRRPRRPRPPRPQRPQRNLTPRPPPRQPLPQPLLQRCETAAPPAASGSQPRGLLGSRQVPGPDGRPRPRRSPPPPPGTPAPGARPGRASVRDQAAAPDDPAAQALLPTDASADSAPWPAGRSPARPTPSNDLGTFYAPRPAGAAQLRAGPILVPQGRRPRRHQRRLQSPACCWSRASSRRGMLGDRDDLFPKRGRRPATPIAERAGPGLSQRQRRHPRPGRGAEMVPPGQRQPAIRAAPTIWAGCTRPARSAPPTRAPPPAGTGSSADAEQRRRRRRRWPGCRTTPLPRSGFVTLAPDAAPAVPAPSPADRQRRSAPARRWPRSSRRRDRPPRRPAPEDQPASAAKALIQPPLPGERPTPPASRRRRRLSRLSRAGRGLPAAPDQAGGRARQNPALIWPSRARPRQQAGRCRHPGPGPPPRAAGRARRDRNGRGRADGRTGWSGHGLPAALRPGGADPPRRQRPNRPLCCGTACRAGRPGPGVPPPAARSTQTAAEPVAAEPAAVPEGRAPARRRPRPGRHRLLRQWRSRRQRGRRLRRRAGPRPSRPRAAPWPEPASRRARGDHQRAEHGAGRSCAWLAAADRGPAGTAAAAGRRGPRRPRRSTRRRPHQPASRPATRRSGRSSSC